MRSSALLFGAAMMLGLAACGNEDEVEPVLPGEGPTYQTEPATAAPAPMITDDSLVLPDSLQQRDSVPPPIDPTVPPPPPTN